MRVKSKLKPGASPSFGQEVRRMGALAIVQ